MKSGYFFILVPIQPPTQPYLLTVLFRYLHMYRGFTDSKSLGSLPHGGSTFNDIVGNAGSTLFNIILQQKSPTNSFLHCIRGWGRDSTFKIRFVHYFPYVFYTMKGCFFGASFSFGGHKKEAAAPVDLFIYVCSSPLLSRTPVLFIRTLLAFLA